MPDSNLHAVTMRMAQGESIEDAARAVCDTGITRRRFGEYAIQIALQLHGRVSMLRASVFAELIAEAIEREPERAVEDVVAEQAPELTAQAVARVARAWTREMEHHARQG